MSDNSNGGGVALAQPGLPFKDEDTFARLDPNTQLVEIIHIPSGKVVAIVGDPSDMARGYHGWTEIENEDGGKVFVQVGVPMDHLPDARKKYTYSHVMADLICEKIATGSLITKVSKIKGMPTYSTIAQWRREHPEFEEKIAQAYRDRAEFFADKAVEVADELRVHTALSDERDENGERKVLYKSDSDSTAAARAKMEAYRIAAAWGNADRFGNKTKVTAEHTGSVSFVIETGVRKSDDPGFFPDESKKLREVNGKGD